MKEQHRADQPHAVLELVAAGAGFALVPLSVHRYKDQRIVYRGLDPAPSPLELTLVRARGVESPTIHALLEVALEIASQQRSFLTSAGRADSHSCSPDLSVRRLSHVREAGRAPTSGPYQLNARSPDTPRPSTDALGGGGKSIRRIPARDAA